MCSWVDGGISLIIFPPIHWGRLSQSNSECTDMASLTSQLALGSHLGLQLPHLPSNKSEFQISKLWSPCLGYRCSPVPLFYFFRDTQYYLYSRSLPCRPHLCFIQQACAVTSLGILKWYLLKMARRERRKRAHCHTLSPWLPSSSSRAVRVLTPAWWVRCLQDGGRPAVCSQSTGLMREDILLTY